MWWDGDDFSQCLISHEEIITTQKCHEKHEKHIMYNIL